MSEEKSKTPVVVITGSAGGLGQALVSKFLAGGFRVAATDLEGQLSKIKMSFQVSEATLLPIAMDVTSRTAVENASKTILSHFGQVDVLINNAGIFERTPILTLDEELTDRIIAINLKGTFNCLGTFSKPMVRQNSGRIINIASIAGERGAALASVYAATKAGVIAAGYSLARELAETGITVNTIVPGFCDTPMLSQEKALMEKFVLPKIPKGRFGNSDEIGEVAYFLATCQAEYLTGSVVRVDGGMSVG